MESDVLKLLLCEVHIFRFLKISHDQAYVILLNAVNQDLIETHLNVTASSL